MANDIEIDKEWYGEHLRRVKHQLGPKYTPELNVDLPIYRSAAFICRSPDVFRLIRKMAAKLNSSLLKATIKDALFIEKFAQIKNEFDNFKVELASHGEYNTDEIPWKSLLEKLNVIYKLTDELWFELQDGRSKGKDYNGSLHYIRESQSIINEINRLNRERLLDASNSRILAVTGEGGIGKTHMLCSIFEERLTQPVLLPTLFLHAADFVDGDSFWDAAIKQLALSGIVTKENLLLYLDRSGKENKDKSLVIIDALNENNLAVPEYWKKELEQIEQDLKKYPNIALIVSYRNGYEERVLSDNHVNRLTKIEHNGLSGDAGWDAMEAYFAHYKITLPNMPMLNQEFTNPLFLRFFCEENRGKSIELKGANALKDVFEHYVLKKSESILRAIDPTKLPRQRRVIWDEIIKAGIARWMINHTSARIPMTELKTIIESLFPTKSDHLIDLLEKELILSRNSYDNTYSFTYNKFSDEIIVRTLLTPPFINSKADRIAAFKKGGLIDQSLVSFKYDPGIIEALCIHTPEFFKDDEIREVHELIEDEMSLPVNYLEDIFIPSLIWRDPLTISGKLKDKVSNTFRRRKDLCLNSVLFLAAEENNPLNILVLDSILGSQSMAERDSWWSTYLHWDYGEQKAVDRILSWSWSRYGKGELSNESQHLMGITLAWMLSTPDRYVRDRATKGLVALYEKNVGQIVQLLRHFEEVNDPYVAERLYAVAYGCTLRQEAGTKGLRKLAIYTYKANFKNEPPTHILLRDYARGIIEAAKLKWCMPATFELKKIMPPFNSKWHDLIATKSNLEKRYYPKSNEPMYNGMALIWLSVMNHGDFDRYIIGTNHGHFEWSARKLGQKTRSLNSEYEKFRNSLTTDQQAKLDACASVGPLDITALLQVPKKPKKVENPWEEFEHSLDSTTHREFTSNFKPHLNKWGRIEDPLENFDLDLAKRWILKRTMELGYSAELHGEYDKMVNNRNGRQSHKAERIGKKYQWIAYHQFLAIISDNFEFKKDRWEPGPDVYMGPWNPHVRDIDPSFIMKNDKELMLKPEFKNWKHSTYDSYDSWSKHMNDKNWIADATDLVDPLDVICRNDDEGNKWLLLDGSTSWKEPREPEDEEKYDLPKREIFYLVYSYLIKKDDIEAFKKWAATANLSQVRYPEIDTMYEPYIGEYPDGLASRCYLDDAIMPQTIADSKFKFDFTNVGYLNEFTLDCSQENSVRVSMLSPLLLNDLGAYHELNGQFKKAEGLIASNGAVFSEKGQPGFHISAEVLLENLAKNDYTICWFIRGEKQVLDQNRDPSKWPGRLNINGWYVHDGKSIVGKVSTKIESR